MLETVQRRVVQSRCADGRSARKEPHPGASLRKQESKQFPAQCGKSIAILEFSLTSKLMLAGSRDRLALGPGVVENPGQADAAVQALGIK